MVKAVRAGERLEAEVPRVEHRLVAARIASALILLPSALNSLSELKEASEVKRITPRRRGLPAEGFKRALLTGGFSRSTATRSPTVAVGPKEAR